MSPIGGEVIAFYLRFIPGYTFVSPTSSSLVKWLDGPSTRDGTYLYKSWSQIFWVGQSCYTISTYISTWFIVFFHLYFVRRFGAAVRLNSKKSWWCRCSRQHVRIYDLIFQKNFLLYPTVLTLHYEQIGHLYDIEMFDQIILYLIALPRKN